MWVEDARVPVVASLGNHDIETANGGPVMDLFDMPNRWYERRVGPVDVFVLDSNDLEEEGQMAWLSTALASSSAPWQVLVFTIPSTAAESMAAPLGCSASFCRSSRFRASIWS